MKILSFLCIQLLVLGDFKHGFFSGTKYNLKLSLSSTTSGDNDLNIYRSNRDSKNEDTPYQGNKKRSVDRANFIKYKNVQLNNLHSSRTSSVLVAYLEKLQVCNSISKNENVDKGTLNSTFAGADNFSARYSRFSNFISQEEVDSILLILKSECPTLSGKSFSHVCYLLGKLQFPPYSLPMISAPLIAYLKCCEQEIAGNVCPLHDLTSSDFISMLKGLARLKVSLTAFHSSLDSSNNSTAFEVPVLMHALQQAVDDAKFLDWTQLSDLMWALCSMRASWTRLPSATRQLLLGHLDHAAIKQSRSMSPYHLSSLLWSLAKIGVRWRDLPASTSGSLLCLRYLNAFAFTPTQASKLLWAIGSFAIPKGTLRNEVVELLLHQAAPTADARFDQEEVVAALSPSESQILVGLLRSGVESSALSSSRY
jgi:hypothetical protein